LAPSATNKLAVAAPMPLAPPVMMATLSASLAMNPLPPFALHRTANVAVTVVIGLRDEIRANWKRVARFVQ
jgi:hypothetical protein